MALDFTWQTLTVAINKTAYRPGQVGRQGLFALTPQATTTANIEIKGDRLALIPDMPRGAPPTPDVQDRRALVDFKVPHFPIRDTIYADSIQDQRGYGVIGLENFPAAVQSRIDSLSYRLDATLEYLRLGACKGVITTAIDRTTGAPLAGRQISLYEAFGVAPNPVRDWPVVGAGADGERAAWESQLTELINSLGRDMADQLPGGMMVGGIWGFAGAQFFDAVSMHPERRAAYIGFPAPETTAPVRGNVIQFRDIMIEEYRGQVGATPFVERDMCYFVPIGIPDLFVEVYAPADYVDTVNTEGLARYLRQELMDFDKGMALEAQMNVLPLCTMPRSLFSAKVTPYDAIAAAATPSTRRRAA
jgi:hypothetical protein